MADLSEVGQHFLMGLRPTTSLHKDDKHMLATLKPLGIVLFRDNFLQDAPYDEWFPAYQSLLNEVAAALGRDDFVVSIDHEGGRVCRPPEPVTQYDYARNWVDKAENVGVAVGRELASMGINLNFAPVLDIDSNPDNPVIGPRAFGTTPEDVVKAGLTFARAMEGEGVVACAKHYPGHGDTAQDSHYELPVVNTLAGERNIRELVPFKAAIEAGMQMIMTSHVMIPDIDPDFPATLSSRIVREELRGRFGYDGVVISDDTGMRAMDSYFKDPSVAADFFASGHDILMICSYWADTDRALGLAEHLIKAKKSASYAQGILAPSEQRLARFRETLPKNTPKHMPPEFWAAHKEVAPLFAGERAVIVR
ncbi:MULTISPECIES: glycoside hydrolase family 3 N-terminal domain-containing protein [Halocynthiibacter]|uniref:beta-N-acetylhexosaminidase n=1 Tax=Halocynthiibacter halioticoli TaxID=2986804 RepID=A0AAE3IW26_9RHOB|nr:MULTISPECIES: glycoside hydrolase family 3 N-terminal domain-containing protein [Halocynthiibacter]MCV6823044.1 hypothetical protein [Halocynthiibacter halioticoli]MCW4056045.1 hypothetical protein [Halocynthiibacter sp. SDUM655004]